MQIIENGPLGLRSAVLQLRSRNHKCTFMLFPMVHIGEPQYYHAVTERLAKCDHILIEGVKHPLFRTMIRTYGRIAASPRFQLSVQTSMAAALTPMRDRIHNIDVPPDLFRKWWRQQPIENRLFQQMFVRLVFWYMARFGDRKRLARHMTLDLGPTRESILRLGDELEFTKLLIHRRDEYIVTKLEEFHLAHCDAPQTIGVLFGADHMRAIIRHLIDRHGYHVAEGSWLTIFRWDLTADDAAAV